MTAAAATSDPRATDAAIGVLRDGGNAVDAAVTAALVLYVVEPQSCGIGGDGFIFVHDGGGAPLALDGSGMVPARLTPVPDSRSAPLECSLAAPLGEATARKEGMEVCSP